MFSTSRLRWAANGFDGVSAPVVSSVIVRAIEKTPSMSPVFSMSTVPVLDSPGLILSAVRTAEPSFLLSCIRLPAVTTLPGFADVELKFAPEPTAIMAASRRANRTPTSFWGDACQTAANRCMGRTFHRGCRRGGSPQAAGRRWYRRTVGDLEGTSTDVRFAGRALKDRCQT